MTRLLLLLTACIYSCAVMAGPVNGNWLTKESVICINGMSVIKYDYNHAQLANTTLDIAVNGKTVRTIKGLNVFDHWDSTLDAVEFVHFKYDGKAYNIYIQDSKGEGIMHFDYTSPAVDCAVMTGVNV